MGKKGRDKKEGKLGYLIRHSSGEGDCDSVLEGNSEEHTAELSQQA